MGNRFKSKLIAVVRSRQVIVVKSGQAAGHMILEQVEAAEAAFSKEWDHQWSTGPQVPLGESYFLFS